MQGTRELRLIVLAVPLLCWFATVEAQATDPKAAVFEIADLNAAMSEVDTLRRLSEDLVFWQSVAIMGAEYGWTFAFNTGDSEMFAWTYRLYNTLDEVPIEAKRARQALARNRSLTEEAQRATEDLYQKFEDMLSLGNDVYQALKADDKVTAAEIFETRTLALRREISRSASSQMIALRDRARKVALDVRLGR